MRLVIVDEYGIVYEVLKDIEAFDLTKEQAQSTIIKAVNNTLKPESIESVRAKSKHFAFQKTF